MTFSTLFMSISLIALGLLSSLQSTPAIMDEPQTDVEVNIEIAQPLVPKADRTHADADRLEAQALFAAGRLHELRGQDSKALRFFQRAHRRDTSSAAILGKIVESSLKQQRFDVAIRYAVKLSDWKHLEPDVRRAVAVLLADQRKWLEAANIYESLLAEQHETNRTATIAMRLELGRLFFLAERFDSAAKEFTSVLESLDSSESADSGTAELRDVFADDTAVYRLFGEAFLEAGQYDRAADMFRRARTDSERLREYDLARVDFARDEPAKAVERLSPLIRQGSLSAQQELVGLFADALRESQGEEEALRQLEALDAKRPSVAVKQVLVREYERQNQLRRAVPLLEELWKRSPSVELAVSLAEFYIEEQDTSSLLKLLGELDKQPESLASIAELEAVLDLDSEKLERLAADLDKLVESSATENTSESNKAFVVAWFLLKAGKADRAQLRFQDVLKGSTESQRAALLTTWGINLLTAGHGPLAAESLQQAVQEKVSGLNEAMVYFYLSTAWQLSGNTEKALRAIRRAMELKNDSILFASRIPSIYYEGGRHKEAKAEYEELLIRFDSQSDDPRDRELLRDARYVLSHLCAEQGGHRAAEEWLEQALDEFPDDVGALNDLAYLWVERGEHLHRSLRMIQRALAAEPENAAYRDSLGWAYYQMGDYDQAVAELKTAASKEPPDPVILEHLGDAYAKAGTWQKARESWQKALGAYQPESQPGRVEELTRKLEESPQS